MIELPWKTEEEFYDMHAQKVFKKGTFYHVGMMGKEEENADYLVSKLNLKSTDKVVDMGCGSGYLTHKIGEKCTSIGISNSKECIKLAKANYPDDTFVLANMENFEVSDVTHFITLESIGYANVEKTLKNVYKSLVDGGILFIKDTSLISNPNKEEKDNIDYWEHYWKYYTLDVPGMISLAYKYGFKLKYFKDINQDAKLNIKTFMESLKDNLVVQDYPHPDISVQILTEFMFQKKARERWVNPSI